MTKYISKIELEHTQETMHDFEHIRWHCLNYMLREGKQESYKGNLNGGRLRPQWREEEKGAGTINNVHYEFHVHPHEQGKWGRKMTVNLESEKKEALEALVNTITKSTKISTQIEEC